MLFQIQKQIKEKFRDIHTPNTRGNYSLKVSLKLVD